MRHLRRPIVVGALALALAGCTDPGLVNADPGRESCDAERGLMVVRRVLDDAGDACYAWVEAVHGRAVRVVFGSGSIWSRRTRHGTGLLTTAAHVLSPCPGEGDCVEALHDPRRELGQALVKLAVVGGGFPAAAWSAHFPLYNPFTPGDQVRSPAILPRHDVSVYVVDPQTFHDDGTSVGIAPGPIEDAPLPLHDPRALTTAGATWATVQPGARVLALGFTNADAESAGELHASVGRVLSDQEAEQAIEQLRAAGDEEGGIAYDSEAEVLVEGRAIAGMSGAGLFDEQGRQVGVLVRASFADIGVQYVRAVRMSYLVDLIEAALASLPIVDQQAVGVYLESR